MKRRICAGLLVVLAAACGLDAVGSLGVGPEDPDAGSNPAHADSAFGDGQSNPADGGPGDGMLDQAAVDGPGPDVLVSPACPSGQVLCGATCTTAADCTTCGSAKLLCKALRTCVPTCASCTDLASAPVPIECVACDTSQQNPIGTCEPNVASTFCLSGNYSTAHNGTAGKQCDCSGAAVSTCPAGSQTCHSVGGEDYCTTCGEDGGATSGKPCKNGKTCTTALSPPTCL